ncbi:MAG: metallophosphoesterase, partial [Actinomycetota bacterium]|nr:metallophosphoesterase [Actinomycetota bacterium]
MSTALRGLGVLAAAGAGALAWSFVEARWYTLREASVPVLEPGSLPLRVLHLSDLHLVPSQRRMIDWIRDLDSLQPDLVVDTGDNWAHPEALAPLLHALEPLLARPGAYVMGSNDYFGPIAKNPAKYLFPRSRPHGKTPPERHLPADLLAKELTAAGWIDLNNRRDTLTLRGTRLDLAGTDDAHIGRDAYPEAGPTSDARQRGPSPDERSRATAPSSDAR